MQTDTMLALQNYLGKDYSEENQLRQTDMLRLILEINQDVVCQGISRLEHCENNTAGFPMLCKGLKLVQNGIEPQVIESILLNMAFVNDVDLLESMLVIDGVISIQTLCSPNVTKELLLSYFRFYMQDQLRKSLQDLKLNSSEPLGMKEIKRLLDEQI